MSDRFSLEGRVGFVTGAARGLGQAMARGLAEHGAFVVLNDLDADALTQTVQRFADDGLKAEGMAFDVSDFAACRVAIADAIAQHGRLDILINNAGISVGAPITEFPLAEWQRHIDIHLTAPFVFCQGGRTPDGQAGIGLDHQHLLDRRARHHCPPPPRPITRVKPASSVSPNHSRSNSARWACVATRLSRATSTPASAAVLRRGEPVGPKQQPFVDDLITHTPLARVADPSEIAGLAVYLASDASSFVNGALIPIDGGLTSMQMPMPHMDQRNKEVVAKAD